MTRRVGKLRLVSRLAAGLMAMVCVLGVSACSEGITGMATSGVKDAAGMTRGEVDNLTPEEQFDLVGERYKRVQELMTDAQEQITTGPWEWLDPGINPVSGPTAWDPMPGATLENAYFMRMARSISPDGAAGARADAEPMAAYFESKGWKTQLTDNEDEIASDFSDYQASAVTEDGYRISYTVQQNGKYNLEITSNMFWGDQKELSNNVTYRVPKDQFFPPDDVSVPGVYVPFPKWSDPKLRGPSVDD